MRLRNLFTPSMLVAVLAMVVALSSASVAAIVITGKQIKNNTVTSVDIKNGTLKVKDLAASTRAALKGATGATGATGAPGATGATGSVGATGAGVGEPLPSGKSLKGSVFYTLDSSSVGQVLFQTVPFTAAAPAPVTKVRYKPDALAVTPSNQEDAACVGTYSAPTAPAGMVCVYPSSNFTINTSTVSLSTLAPGQNLGYYLGATASAAGTVWIDFSWAYTAP